MVTETQEPNYRHRATGKVHGLSRRLGGSKTAPIITLCNTVREDREFEATHDDLTCLNCIYARAKLKGA